MKVLLFSLLAILFGVSTSFSQDTITMRTHEEIQAKVFEISTTEVKYKKYDNQNGPVFVILKSDVLSIRYENGTKDVFNIENEKSVAIDTTPSAQPVSILFSEMTGNDYYIKGQKDATRYYYKYNSASTWTLVTSLVSPLLGLAPAIACGSTPPKKINLDYPNLVLTKNADYHRGYDERAMKIKKEKFGQVGELDLG